MTGTPTVLFVCVHNAGRSQMAAALLTRRAGSAVRVLSAGSAPAVEVNPAVIDVMREIGIDLAAERPTLLDRGDLDTADVVITMGCGDACPIVPGKRYLDWAVDDPAGQGSTAVRRIRDEIGRRVDALVSQLLPTESGQ